MPLLHPLSNTVQTLSPNDVTSARWQQLYQEYFDFIFVQWKWKPLVRIFNCNCSVQIYHIISKMGKGIFITWKFGGFALSSADGRSLVLSILRVLPSHLVKCCWKKKIKLHRTEQPDYYSFVLSVLMCVRCIQDYPGSLLRVS